MATKKRKATLLYWLKWHADSVNPANGYYNITDWALVGEKAGVMLSMTTRDQAIDDNLLFVDKSDRETLRAALKKRFEKTETLEGEHIKERFPGWEVQVELQHHDNGPGALFGIAGAHRFMRVPGRR